MFKVDLKFDKNNNFTDLLPPRAKKKMQIRWCQKYEEPSPFYSVPSCFKRCLCPLMGGVVNQGLTVFLMLSLYTQHYRYMQQ